MGSIGEFYNDRFFQFSKLSSPFKLSYLEETFVVSDLRQTLGAPNNGFRLDEVIKYLSNHEVVFFGKIALHNEFHSNTSIVDESRFFSFDREKNVFVSLRDGALYEEKNIFSLIYFFKINSTNAYMMVLNSLVDLENVGSSAVLSSNSSTEVTLVVSQHGNSVRSKLINLAFSSNISVVNNDRTNNTFMLHLKDSTEGAIKLFNANPFYAVTDELVNGFKIEVESNLNHSLVKDEVKFSRSSEKFGYVKVSIKSNQIFNAISEGNVFERLEFIFYVF